MNLFPLYPTRWRKRGTASSGKHNEPSFYHVADGGTSHTNMETQNTILNFKQRELFTKLLSQAKTRAQEELESDYAVNQRVKEELLPKLAEEHGATELVGKVTKLSKELKDFQSALEKIGFDCDSDGD